MGENHKFTPSVCAISTRHFCYLGQRLTSEKFIRLHRVVKLTISLGFRPLFCVYDLGHIPLLRYELGGHMEIGAPYLVVIPFGYSTKAT